MPCESDDGGRNEPERHIRGAQAPSWLSPQSSAPPGEQPDQHGRGSPEDQVQTQVALEPLAAVLPLPGKEPGGHGGQGGARPRDQVVVSGGRSIVVAPPTRAEGASGAGPEQSNRKVGQDP